MTNTFDDHEGTVSIGCRTITNLRFADDIDGLAGKEEELAILVERLDKASTAYSTEISAEKTKLMTNNTSINTAIKVIRQKLETVTSFKYLGSVISDEGSKPEIISRIALVSIDKAKPVWNDRSISLSSKLRLMCSLVTSIFLSACESWILTEELQRIIKAMEIRCHRKVIRLSHKDHVTNEGIHAKIQLAIGPHKGLLTIVRDANCSNMDMSPVRQVWPKPSCKALLKGGRRQGRQKRGRKTSSGNGQSWSSPSPRGHWRTENNGGNWL